VITSALAMAPITASGRPALEAEHAGPRSGQAAGQARAGGLTQTARRCQSARFACAARISHGERDGGTSWPYDASAAASRRKSG
jgi:hypothetical protein